MTRRRSYFPRQQAPDALRARQSRLRKKSECEQIKFDAPGCDLYRGLLRRGLLVGDAAGARPSYEAVCEAVRCFVWDELILPSQRDAHSLDDVAGKSDAVSTTANDDEAGDVKIAQE